MMNAVNVNAVLYIHVNMVCVYVSVSVLRLMSQVAIDNARRILFGWLLFCVFLFSVYLEHCYLFILNN